MGLHHQHEPPAGKTKPQHNSTGKAQRTPAGPCPPLGKRTQQAGGPLKNGTAPRRNAHFPLGGPGSGDGNPGGLKVKAAARRRRPPSPYLTPHEREDWRTQDGLMAGWDWADGGMDGRAPNTMELLLLPVLLLPLALLPHPRDFIDSPPPRDSIDSSRPKLMEYSNTCKCCQMMFWGQRRMM